MTESQDNTINANLTPLPDRVGVDGLEDKWRGVWDESGVYKFQGTRDRKAVYSIDTPPPTVSGHLHVGHYVGSLGERVKLQNSVLYDEV